MRAALLTLAEVAAHVRRHPRTVRTYVHDGQLKAIRVGNALRFEPAEVERFLGDDAVSPLDAHVAALVAEAPALSESQRSALAALLGGAR